MLELVVCQHIRNGYKVVLPSSKKVRVASKYARSIYTSPSQVQEGDKLKFIGWVSANNDDRTLWKKYL